LAEWNLIIEETPLSATANMARDEFLFNLCHQEKIGFFRLYSWEIPTFSFGASQKISRAINLDFVEKGMYAFVRRITGGKTVLHNHEITYAVISSEDIFFKDNDLYQSYSLISKVLVDAFNSLDIPAYLSDGSPSHLSRSNNPCFSFPTPNELEIHGKKIVGSAQKRDKKALLQHGSIPLSMDYELYASGTNSRPGILKRSMTTLSEVSKVRAKDLQESLVKSFSRFIDQEMENFKFSASQLKEIVKIEEKYDSEHWNFMR